MESCPKFRGPGRTRATSIKLADAITPFRLMSTVFSFRAIKVQTIPSFLSLTVSPTTKPAAATIVGLYDITESDAPLD
jgi:hypothetical protein